MQATSPLSFRPRALLLAAAAAALSLLILSAPASHGAAKPAPALRAVDPGPPGGPPSDAVVLFDGRDLSAWRARKGGDARWKIEDGDLVATSTGDIITRERFGDVQLHIEWNLPAGGNSGIKFHEWYEIQIYDGGARSPVKGRTGAVYKQHAPLVDASRKPGQWQTFDIIFRAPRFDASGKLVKHGRFTVLHNGVLVQDNARILGITNSSRKPTTEYERPLLLQYHGAPVRFRNIWIRRLAPRPDDA